MRYRRMLPATPPDVVAAIGEPGGGDSARRQAITARVPVGPGRWLIDLLAGQQANSFLRIVRILDELTADLANGGRFRKTPVSMR
ncbi:hypothetical protein [Allorhizocola rhizosphaerae]|uniref:hypothetical protein n=1 Tax=Allorhizocola rhizosphaerae TaxID=1872709 RepID=UPI000E3B9ABD|nr:hypothetical protein [Allorhizocola rhizosphaerae]